MNIPLINLNQHHAPRRAEYLAVIAEVIDSGAFAGGPAVERFEEAFAAYCRNDYAIGVSSGTDALWMTLLAMEVGAGDEVITVPNSFIATAEAISRTGARPVFVDVDPETLNMDPSALDAAVTGHTKAVIPVHLYGHPADMDGINQIARKHGLRVIEDAAQAHGAEYRNQRVGSLADAACFSFYPGKNLGAFGEAGAVVTADPFLREKVRMLRNHGQDRRYEHSLMGWNCRMDGIQAAILNLKLRDLDRTNDVRRCRAVEYRALLAGCPWVSTPAEHPHVRHAYHLYVIRTRERDAVREALSLRGIDCGVHYPIPVHLQQAFAHLGYQEGDFPVAEAACRSVLSLPICPEISSAALESVVDALKGIRSSALVW